MRGTPLGHLSKCIDFRTENGSSQGKNLAVAGWLICSKFAHNGVRRRVYRINTEPSTVNPRRGLQPLHPQHSTLNNQYSTLNTQHPTLNTQHPTPNTQHPAPNTQHPLNTQHSSLITQHFTLDPEHPSLGGQSRAFRCRA